jgi:serine/threonine-protein kinase
MFSKAGVVKVMDFGTARLGGAGQGNTTATAVVGTAHYLSPEQINGGRVDARSDIYAVGCVLYELLCGRPPFTGPSPVAVAHQHVREVANPPSDFAPGLPRQLDAVTLKAMSKNPLNRYQNAAEMRADLLRALAGQAVSATPLLREVVPVQVPVAKELVGAAAGQWGSPPAGQERRPPAATNGPALLAPVETLPDIESNERSANDAAVTRRRMRIAAIAAVSVAVIAAIWLTLLVVTAPPIAPKVSVPDLSGMTLEQAQATLRDKQLTLGTVTEVDSPKASTGRVVNQRPSELTQVDETTPVNIEIDNS